MIKSLKTYLIRVAFDIIDETEEVERGIKLLLNAGVRGKKILCYNLFNRIDDVQ